MNNFPYITEYINEVFNREKERWDYLLLRPVLLILYFFVRSVVFPLKYLLHRNPYGFEARLIDSCLAFGMKYLASHDAAELLIRHAQIEPTLYRYLLTGQEIQSESKKLQGIDGDFAIGSLDEMVENHMTVGHDELSYEIMERFNKEKFIANLEKIKKSTPDDHKKMDKGILEENKKHSLQLLGATNVVMLIVFAITIFGDLKTTMKALNSFSSDSIVLWCMKHIFEDNKQVMIDLDFYMQIYSNRGHYNSSAFFSDPSQYLYYHICFDEFAYHNFTYKTVFDF